ncbi:MAG: MBL fold metallo-hydrolase [Candidatus Hodarchaeota archaeon]
MEVVRDLHFVSGVLSDSNVYVLGKDEITLIDVGTGDNLNRLFKVIDSCNLDSKDIKQVIVTHAHIDHIGGLSMISELLNPRICAPSEETPYIEKGDDYMILAWMFNSKFEPVRVDTKLNEGDRIHAEEFSLRVLHTPGHTKGSICLYDEERKILFSGDTVFSGGGFGRVDLPTGNAEDLRKSLLELSKLEVEYLLPGHMSIVTKGVHESIKRSYMNIEFLL